MDSLKRRSILRGVLWAGAITAFLVFARPDVVLLRAVVVASIIGAVVSLWEYRKGTGRVPLPDGVLLATFSAMLLFWIRVLSTGAEGMSIDAITDLISAVLVMAFPASGIILVLWHRHSSGTHFLQREVSGGATPQDETDG